jgi:hypothetical protein
MRIEPPLTLPLEYAMTENRMLQLAAIASGRHSLVTIDPQFKTWNPRRNPADAMALAVQLRLDLQHSVGSYCSVEFWSAEKDSYEGVRVENGESPMDATLLAITRAAAEIGRKQEQAPAGLTNQPEDDDT